MYHLLVDLIIMLLVLMMQLKKLGFIAFDKNLMFLKLLRNGKLWLRMRQKKGQSVSDQKMEMNTTARSLMIIVHTMAFVQRKQFQEHHKKMVC
jgi:hypothetical protein